MAKSRASRDGAPGGVRLINNGNNYATEVQFLETPPIVVPPAPTAPNPTTQYNLANAPRLEYATGADGAFPGTWTIANPPAAVSRRSITAGSTVLVPSLGTWFTLTGTGTSPMSVNTSNPAVLPWPNIGVGTKVETYQFAIYGPPQPLLGEPVQQLPSNIGVDLLSSSPSTASGDVDLVFTPGGDLMSASTAQIMLWVRDIVKNGGDPAKYPGASFTTGGAQQVVAVKTKSGRWACSPSPGRRRTSSTR